MHVTDGCWRRSLVIDRLVASGVVDVDDCERVNRALFTIARQCQRQVDLAREVARATEHAIAAEVLVEKRGGPVRRNPRYALDCVVILLPWPIWASAVTCDTQVVQTILRLLVYGFRLQPCARTAAQIAPPGAPRQEVARWQICAEWISVAEMTVVPDTQGKGRVCTLVCSKVTVSQWDAASSGLTNLSLGTDHAWCPRRYPECALGQSCCHASDPRRPSCRALNSATRSPSSTWQIHQCPRCRRSRVDCLNRRIRATHRLPIRSLPRGRMQWIRRTRCS